MDCCISLLSLQCYRACADGNEDIVLSTFRQQQKAYRDLLEGMKAGPFTISYDKLPHLDLQWPRSRCADHQQLMCCPMQSIPVPLNGDESAIRKYADDVEALKKKVNMPCSLSSMLCVMACPGVS